MSHGSGAVWIERRCLLELFRILERLCCGVDVSLRFFYG